MDRPCARTTLYMLHSEMGNPPLPGRPAALDSAEAYCRYKSGVVRIAHSRRLSPSMDEGPLARCDRGAVRVQSDSRCVEGEREGPCVDGGFAALKF